MTVIVIYLFIVMEHGFEIKSGSVAIGDPAMGLAIFDLNLAPGHYCCIPGALRESTDDDSPSIALDGPFLFVVDATCSEGFQSWFHRVFNECGFVIPKVAMRLDEARAELGVEIGFYWEETLSGKPQEGTYSLDSTKIIREPTN